MSERIASTIEEFFQLPETSDITEYINGEIYVSPAPTGRHQIVLGNIHFVLRSQINSGKFLLAPSDLRLGNNGVQPDLFWIAEDNNQCVLVDQRIWQGAPNLVVEVVSPSTAKRDRGDKFHIYEANGVPEYWIIEPDAEFIEVYVLEDRQYRRQGVYEAKDSFISQTLNEQTIDVSKLFEV